MCASCRCTISRSPNGTGCWPFTSPGTFLVCRAVLPVLREGGGGAIVNMASASAAARRPHLAAYAAAKGGIIAFSRQLALDAHDYGVRVKHDRSRQRRHAAARGRLRRRRVPHAIQARVAEPDEIAAVRVLPALRRRELHDAALGRRRRRGDCTVTRAVEYCADGGDAGPGDEDRASSRVRSRRPAGTASR